jgi:hypothetical protein
MPATAAFILGFHNNVTVPQYSSCNDVMNDVEYSVHFLQGMLSRNLTKDTIKRIAGIATTEEYLEDCCKGEGNEDRSFCAWWNGNSLSLENYARSSDDCWAELMTMTSISDGCMIIPQPVQFLSPPSSPSFTYSSTSK